MIEPTREQWACLKPVERFNFKLLDAANRNPSLRRVFRLGAHTIGMGWVEAFVSNLCVAHGFENFEKRDPDRGLLLVSNHRTFFDLHAVAGRLFRFYGDHHHISFPIRSEFFYDSLLGPFVSLPLAMGSTYPPIIRDNSRKAWNRFAVDLMVELLQSPENMVGFHPEGKRNKGPDPYELLPGKVGAGELIHRARPNVIPVFLQGFPRYAWHGILLNHGLMGKRPIWTHMVMGEPIDFTEEWTLEPGKETYLAISRKVMQGIKACADREKIIRVEYEKAA